MTMEGCPKEDDFPAGMRVLAVDDDPTCLKLLEGMLRRCKYHVTTTSQAINALKLLRENVDMFDLVLSDVHMPDMDGFKLLELIGLEMDLPVIMMSVNGETSTVMKGITHGACDYLLKPIRLEELRNIWQHVLRRRKGGSKNEKCGKVKVDTPVQGSNALGHTESNCKLVRKRREQNNEEDEEENSEKENDEQSSQKRARVVWSVELHQKFVAAVNQLGIDKAFPKRILDIMNDDKLSRENVASHLQKYRLYLKRMANQQGNMNPLGARDSSFLPIDRFRDFNSQGMIQEFSNARLTSQGATTLGGLHSRDLTFNSTHNSPGMIQLGYMPTLKNPFDDLRKANHTTLSGHYQGNMFQASPTLSQVNCLQNKSSLLGNDGSSTLIGDGLSFSAPQYQPTDVSSFSNDVLSNRISSNTFLSVPNNPTRIEVIQPNQGQYMGTENLSAIIQEQIYANSGSSSSIPELDGCNKSLQNAAQMMRYSTVLPMVHPQKNSASGLNNNNSWRPPSLDPNMVHPVKSVASGLNGNNSRGPSSLDPNMVDLSSLSTITTTSHESAYGRQLTQAIRGDESARHFSLGNDDASKFSSLSRSTGNGTPWSSTGCTLNQGFDMQQVLYDNSLNAISGSSICSSFQPHQLVGHPNQYSAKPNGDGLFDEDNFDWTGQGALAAPLYAMQPVAAEESTADGIVKLENHLLSNTRFPDILDTNGASNCLVDIVNTLKRRAT